MRMEFLSQNLSKFWLTTDGGWISLADLSQATYHGHLILTDIGADHRSIMEPTTDRAYMHLCQTVYSNTHLRVE